mgnify:CR=1 FL=1
MFIPKLRQTINTNALDNFKIYPTIADIDMEQVIENRFYLITSENKYYRYVKDTDSFVVAITEDEQEVTALQNQIHDIQNYFF